MQIREKGEIPLLGRVSVFILNSECFLIVEHRPLGRKRIIKAGYTATSYGRVGRGINARFPPFWIDHFGPMDQRLDRRRDQWMDKDSYRVECLQLKTWLASHINNFAYLHATKAVLSVVVPICWMVCLSNCQNLLLRHIASLPLPIDKIAFALLPMHTHTHLQAFIRFLTNSIWGCHPHK